jgi:hypothetical protein
MVQRLQTNTGSMITIHHANEQDQTSSEEHSFSLTGNSSNSSQEKRKPPPTGLELRRFPVAEVQRIPILFITAYKPEQARGIERRVGSTPKAFAC